MPRALHLLTLLLTGCLASSCVAQKSIAPEVVAAAQVPGNWYSYMPERAPGFCLCTERAFTWSEPGMQLGCWRGLHPDPPHRVLMEARGDTLTVYRHYLWDGMTVGKTQPRDLLPTLRHDALYHALKEGASFPRAEADRAFLRDMRRAGMPCPGLTYALIRTFGGFFLDREAVPTMLVEELVPAPIIPRP